MDYDPRERFYDDCIDEEEPNYCPICGRETRREMDFCDLCMDNLNDDLWNLADSYKLSPMVFRKFLEEWQYEVDTNDDYEEWWKKGGTNENSRY